MDMEQNNENTFLAEQPEWKLLLAKQFATNELKPFWAENVKPAWKEAVSKEKETMQQAAVENGFDSAMDYKNTYEWGKNLSQELKNKLTATANRHQELFAPYKKKYEDAVSLYETKREGLVADFIVRLNGQARKLISDENLIKRGVNGMAIRCKVDGQQQMGRDLTSEDIKRLGEIPDKRTTIRNLAEKYFRDEIIESMGLEQIQSVGLKR